MSNDFFSSVSNNNNHHSSPQIGHDNVRTFADAISHRFAPSPTAPSLLTARLLHNDHHHHHTTMPPTTTPTTTMSTASFIAVPPSSLPRWLADDDDDANNNNTLIVDIRPPQAYATARLPRALSLSVPSTLLKRPNFSLDRLVAMLPSPTARSRFTRWHTSTRILVYDADSAAIPDNSNIYGLLRKFRNDPVHYAGDLAWVVGGFQAVWRDQPRLIDNSPPFLDPEIEDDDSGARPILRARDLPMSAFSYASTTAASLSPARPTQRPSLSARLQAQGVPSLSLPFSHLHLPLSQRQNTPLPSSVSHSRSSSGVLSLGSLAHTSHPPVSDVPAISSAGTSLPSNMSLSIPASQYAYNPFFDTIRQNTELSHGITERIPLRLPRRVRKRVHELPFRWLQDIARKAEARTPPGLATVSDSKSVRLENASSSSSDSECHSPVLPSPAPPPDPADVDEGTEALAMQFYRIELAEQRRMMGVMDHHSKESETAAGEHERRTRAKPRHRYSRQHRSQSQSPVSSPPEVKVKEASSDESTPFPFSITAGVEKGAKNRYRYIWPFEHARVRLHQRYRRKRSISSPSYAGSPGSGRLPSTPSPFFITDNPRDSGSINTNTGNLAPRPTNPASALPPTPGIHGRSAASRSLRPQSQLATFASSLHPFPSPQSFHSQAPSIPYGAGGVIPSIYTHGLTPGNAPVVSPASSDVESEYDDYVNASYVQPLGTTKRYIATQGPMPATFKDFWTLVWEQNVHVIVMLTRQVEGGMIKCGPYWTQERFGPLRLRLVEESGREHVEQDISASSNPFEAAAAVSSENSSGKGRPKLPTIRRVFDLWHTKYPIAGARRIIQLQFLEWPDMNVPNDPRDVLDLIWRLEKAVEETNTYRYTREQEVLARKHHEKAKRDSEQVSREEAGSSGRSRTITNDSSNTKQSDQRSFVSSSSSDDDVDEYTGIVKHAIGDRIPILLHCSAGVGRTGGFLAIDAVLDGVRREMRKHTYGRLSSDLGSSGDASVSAMCSATGSVRGSAVGPAGASAHGSATGVAHNGSGLGSVSAIGSGNVADRSAGYEDRMDVDESSPGEVENEVAGDKDVVGAKMAGTVPIAMSAGDANANDSARGSPEERFRQGKKVHGTAKEVDGRGGLVVHVPFVVGGDRDTHKTPIQTAMEVDEDEDDLMVGGEAGGEEQKASTRKWAEAVLDETSAAMDTGEPMDDSGSGKSQSSIPMATILATPTVAGNPADEVGTGVTSGGGRGDRSTSVCASGSSGSEESFGFGSRGHRRHHPSHSHLYESTRGSGTSTSLATSISAGSGSGNGSSSPSERGIKEKGTGGAPKLISSKLSSPSPYLALLGEHQKVSYSSSKARHVDETDPNPVMNIDTGTSVTTPPLMGQASPSPAIGGTSSYGAKPGYNAAGIGPSPLGPAFVIAETEGGGKIISAGDGAGHRNLVGGRFRSGVNLEAPRRAPLTSDDSRSASTTSLSPMFSNNAYAHSSSPQSARNVGSTGIAFPSSHPPTMTNLRDVRGTSVFSSEDEPPPSRSISLSPSASGASEAQYESVGSKLETLFDGNKSSTRDEKVVSRRGRSSDGDGGDNEAAPDDGKHPLPKTTKDDSNSDSRPGSASPPVSRSRSTPPSFGSGAGKKTRTVDYKEPRPLHGNMSPPALSSYEDPICELVQDMREQRMSLCQSLRQYVFVHAAIIEGVLMMVDEERARVKVLLTGSGSRSSGSGIGSPKSKLSRSIGGGSASGSGSGSTSANEDCGSSAVLPSFPATPIRVAAPSVPSAMTMSPSTGKRGASPTELLKEDKKGAILLSKRPSLKRKQTSSDGSRSTS